MKAEVKLEMIGASSQEDLKIAPNHCATRLKEVAENKVNLSIRIAEEWKETRVMLDFGSKIGGAEVTFILGGNKGDGGVN